MSYLGDIHLLMFIPLHTLHTTRNTFKGLRQYRNFYLWPFLMQQFNNLQRKFALLQHFNHHACHGIWSFSHKRWYFSSIEEYLKLLHPTVKVVRSFVLTFKYVEIVIMTRPNTLLTNIRREVLIRLVSRDSWHNLNVSHAFCFLCICPQNYGPNKISKGNVTMW